MRSILVSQRARRSSSLNVQIWKIFLPTRSEGRCKAAHEMLGSSSCQRFRPRWTKAGQSDGKLRSSVYGSFSPGRKQVQVPKHPIGGAEDLLDEQQVVDGEVVQTKVD